MIGDKNLQLASNLDATAASTLGFQITPDVITSTQVRDLMAGCQLYARVCIRTSFTSAAIFGTTVFSVRVSSASLAGSVIDSNPYDYLIPSIGASEIIPTASLTKGTVVHFPLNAQASQYVIPGLFGHDARGDRVLMGAVSHWDTTGDPSLPTRFTPTAGNWDMDIVLAPDNGVAVAGANYQAIGPFYPTAITQV